MKCPPIVLCGAERLQNITAITRVTDESGVALFQTHRLYRQLHDNTQCFMLQAMTKVLIVVV